MARKVLSTGQDAIRLTSPDRSTDKLFHCFSISAKGAVTDDGIFRIREDVTARRKNKVHSTGGQFFCQQFVNFINQLRRIMRRNFQHGRELGEVLLES